MPEEMLSAVIAQAASELQIDATSFEVIVAEAVTWNDGSLGCPEPGMAYTQALVPGYRAVLGLGPERYAYHGDSSGQFRFCEDPRPPLDSNPND
jgi:hypothetical protein